MPLLEAVGHLLQLEEAMKQHLLGLAAGALLFPLTAHADYTGPYVGAEFGYSNTEVKVDLLDDTMIKPDDDGVTYGGVVGYRHNMNGLVIGVEGRAGDSDNKLMTTVDTTDASASSKRELGISGILGYTPDDRVLIFGIVGYQNLKGKLTIDGVSDTDTDDGIRYGGGVEYGVTENVSIRATVTRTDYGKQFTDAEAADFGAQLDINQTQVIGGLIFSY